MSRETMIGDEIYKRLKGGWWWNINNRQPSIYLVVAVLEMLPLVNIAGGEDVLELQFSRDLTRLEYWSLDRLMPDDIKRDGYTVTLWWD